MVQWLCPHQVEMEMILVEIVEHVFQKETFLHRLQLMKMRRKMRSIRGAHVQL
jgi:hypothetical protein